MKKWAQVELSPEEQAAAKLSADLIESTRIDGGGLGLTVHPAFYSQLKVFIRVVPKEPKGFRLTMEWRDRTPDANYQKLTLEIDPVKRRALVIGTNRHELARAPFRVVLPTRPSVFVMWPEGGCELQVWNGCVRYQILMRDGAAVGKALVDSVAKLPRGFCNLDRVDTLVPLCDGSVYRRDRNEPTRLPKGLKPIDQEILESLPKWAGDRFGASMPWQKTMFEVLARVEDFDEQATRIGAAEEPRERLRVTERRSAAARDLNAVVDEIEMRTLKLSSCKAGALHSHPIN